MLVNSSVGRARIVLTFAPARPRRLLTAGISATSPSWLIIAEVRMMEKMKKGIRKKTKVNSMARERFLA